MESRIRTNKTNLGYKFISRFEMLGGDRGNIYCPTFHVLHQGVGCPYRCSYCFLQNTLRGKTHPRFYINYETLVKEVKDWLLKTKVQTILNTGELTDSYAVSTAYIPHILPLFVDPKSNPFQHLLMFLSKSASYPKDLLKPHPLIKLGWSINAPEIAAKYEPSAPSVAGRLKAAMEAKQEGHCVRIRMDPVIPVPGWKEFYTNLLKEIIKIKPEIVTFRTIRAQGNLRMWAARGNASTGANPFLDLQDYFVRDGDDRAMRIQPDFRCEVYTTLGAVLTKAGIEWGLCKETLQVLRRVGKLNHKCNCTP